MRKHIKVYDAGEEICDRYTVAIGYGPGQLFVAFWQGGGYSHVGEARDGYRCGKHLGKRLWTPPKELQAKIEAYLDDTYYTTNGASTYDAIMEHCKTHLKGK